FPPALLLAGTTATGGDMGAHIYAPWYMRNYLFPKGLVAGWSPGWFAGFPMFYFYFPLVAAFQALLSYLIPYDVAFKLGTVLGTFFLPVAMFLLLRLIRLPFPTPEIGAVLAMAFLLMDSFQIFGGNIAGSMAGEYSYGLSLGLCLVSLGLSFRIVTEEGRPVVAALTLSAAVLSHLVPVILVVAFLPILLVLGARTHGLRRSLVRLGVVFGLAFCLTGFWVVPFLVRLSYTTNMHWTQIRGLGHLFPQEIWLFIPPAVAGACAALLRRDRRAIVIGFLTLFGSLAYFLLPSGHVWNGRFVPAWYIGVYGFCAYFLGSVLPSMLSMVWRRQARLAGVIVLALVTVSVLGSILERRDETYVDDWIRGNYTGYERSSEWPKLEELMQHVAALPPGRVLWEPSLEMEAFGTELAPMLMPYWAGHPSMEGLYYESGITTPFHFLTVAEVSERPSNPIGTLPYRRFNLQRGIDHMQLLDVSWYVTFSDLARRAALRSPRLELVDEFGVYAIFAVETPGQVVIPEYEPVVLEERPWIDANVAWFSDPAALAVPLAAEGPPEWARTNDPTDPPTTLIPGGGVSVPAEVTDDQISFHTDAVGVPHWIKTSYFPNWKAEGALGPFLASPTMMVVVPTQPDVRIEFERTWAEWLGLVLTFSALGLMVLPSARRELLSAGWSVEFLGRDRLPASERSGVARVSMFGVVSVVTTAVDFGLFNLLVSGDVAGPVVANVISYTAGLSVSYVLNKRYTFAGGGRDRLSRELGTFTLLNLLALGLSTAAVAGVVAMIGNRPILLNGAKLAAGAATWVLKYVAFERWVYPRHPTIGGSAARDDAHPQR
ncbi:MAG: GtrA family protein, partial [Actinomycetota bacterium]